MKAQEGGFSIPFLPKLSFEKQDTLLKLCVLSIAAILCKYIYIMSAKCFEFRMDQVPAFGIVLVVYTKVMIFFYWIS